MEGRTNCLGSERTSGRNLSRRNLPLRAGEIESIDDRDISFGEVDGVARIVIIVRCSEKAQQKLGVRRTSVAT